MQYTLTDNATAIKLFGTLATTRITNSTHDRSHSKDTVTDINASIHCTSTTHGAISTFQFTSVPATSAFTRLVDIKVSSIADTFKIFIVFHRHFQISIILYGSKR